jgi:predicted choloylglycine hydrolase
MIFDGGMMMKQVKGYFSYLQGTSYEVGKAQGKMIKASPQAFKHFILDTPDLSEMEWKETERMIDRFCPVIHEEINGFCDEIKISPKQLAYYQMTWLQPGCSHCVVLPSKTKENRTYVLRNYDLSPEMDEMRLCSTNITGMYRHAGFSTAFFGRSEGMNEAGLCVTFSACGMPVGDYPGMRKPKVKGLQFWAVVRALLERCQNVKEAIALIKEMPIASNMNLLAADPSGRAALIETFDGQMAIEETDNLSSKPFLTATNHIIVPEMEAYQQKKVKHSVSRYELLNELHATNLTFSAPPTPRAKSPF